MILCAAGANPRVEWMLRSHDVAYSVEEEARVEGHLQSRTAGGQDQECATKCDRALLFFTIHEALEFCENVLIHDLKADKATTKRPSFVKSPTWCWKKAIQYNEFLEHENVTSSVGSKLQYSTFLNICLQYVHIGGNNTFFSYHAHTKSVPPLGLQTVNVTNVR
jgi:hypothetical protein